jgi:hypothetical protein
MRSAILDDEGFYQIRDLPGQQAERARQANGNISQTVLPAFSRDANQSRLLDTSESKPSKRDILLASMRFKSRKV